MGSCAVPCLFRAVSHVRIPSAYTQEWVRGVGRCADVPWTRVSVNTPWTRVSVNTLPLPSELLLTATGPWQFFFTSAIFVCFYPDVAVVLMSISLVAKEPSRRFPCSVPAFEGHCLNLLSFFSSVSLLPDSFAGGLLFFWTRARLVARTSL